jgi:hypothetical protein
MVHQTERFRTAVPDSAVQQGTTPLPGGGRVDVQLGGAAEAA